jgi:hypothetical protein
MIITTIIVKLYSNDVHSRRDMIVADESFFLFKNLFLFFSSLFFFENKFVKNILMFMYANAKSTPGCLSSIFVIG